MRATKHGMALVATFVSLGMWYFAAEAGDTIKTRGTLRGLESVYVQIVPFDPELQKELRTGGLTHERVRQAVERKLEQGGIKVLREEDLQKSQGHGILDVNLQILSPETQKKYKYTVEGAQISKDAPVERYFYSVDVELRQAVSLLREPGIKEVAPTWSTSTLGLRRVARIESDIKDQVEKFISAYRIVNPK
ncbi:MAG: hypothetical protein JSV60_00545 [Desulfobacterales bacterium]|nr:MAG: hypothetical protein JSV60_00545 [Desulfobacterales bacterium]